MKHITPIFILVLTLLLTAVSSHAISIPEEREVAKDFMKMIKDKNMILKDPVSAHMVNQVGRHILSFLPPQPFDYSFYVIDDDVFNAFASPAANIFFYRGLITSLDNIDELAGIMAHEIAHAASRHVSESIDRSKYISLGSLAGVLAGAIIGSQSDNGEAGAVVMQGSMALGTTAMLAFTRENETEADEKGIMFLKQSCFNPEGLLSGLMKIRKADYRGVEAIPEYVKTHPGTANRIAHTETILSGYTPPPDKALCHMDLEFDMVKYRLMGLYSDIDSAFNLIKSKLAEYPSTPALHLGLALLYDRKFMKDKAIEHLQEALSVKIFDPMILLEMGRIYTENDEAQKAIEVLEGVKDDPVMGLMAKYHLGVAYMETGELDKAEKLFKLVIDRAPEIYPKAYFHQADILSRHGETGRSHYFLGVYYSETGSLKTARIHLRKALENLGDSQEAQKAKKLLEKIERKKSPEVKAGGKKPGFSTWRG